MKALDGGNGRGKSGENRERGKEIAAGLGLKCYINEVLEPKCVKGSRNC